MTHGRKITIYLEDGSMSGIRHAEIVNWTGQCISVPRTFIKSLPQWGEATRPGVYFLFGIDESSGSQAVYIGEAENVSERLQAHLAGKEFWNEAVFFSNKDENLTKAHIKYLESRLVKITKSAGRYVVLNQNDPTASNLPRGDRDAMEEFILNLAVLISVLGHRVLEPLAKHETIQSNSLNLTETTTPDNSTGYVFLNVKGISAFATLTDEGIVVLKGSSVSQDVRDSLSVGYKKLRDQLQQTGVITQTAEGPIFAKDFLFTSPSQAAAIIVGYAINGRHHWQTQAGLTINDMEKAVD